VATPPSRSELGRVEPGSHTLRSIPRRLARKQDPWAGLPDRAGDLPAAQTALEELPGVRGARGAKR
jgi:bifunctional non-homologous end joining protein LigD